MKLPLLSIFCTFLLGTTTSFAQQRLVLFEEFNGPCDAAAVSNPITDALMSAGTNPQHICMLKYYVSGGDALFLMTAENDTARGNYYGIVGMPIARIDGAITSPSSPTPGYTAYFTQAEIDAAAAVPSPFQMSVKGVLNAAKDSITTTVKVKAVAPYAPAEGIIKLRTARVKTIVFTPYWPDGQNIITNSVRNMYPDAHGITIDGTWAVGDSQTYVIKGPVLKEENWLNTIIATDSFMVAWIQNDNDHKVAQAAKEGLVLPSTTAIPGENNDHITGFRLTPNPAKEAATILFNANTSGSMNIHVLDVLGKKVYASPTLDFHPGQNNIQLDAHLPNGIYYVKLHTNTGIQNTQVLSIIK